MPRMHRGDERRNKAMKRISLALDDTTYDLVLKEAISRMDSGSLPGKKISKKAVRLIIETIMDAFPSDVLLCDKCEKVFSIETDEGSVREEGVFCNKHLPKETEE
ncbi:MAG: hypothetical protein ACYC9S_08815 [Leptospirales bacterium]